jgi:hypothetical protein
MIKLEALGLIISIKLYNHVKKCFKTSLDVRIKLEQALNNIFLLDIPFIYYIYYVFIAKYLHFYCKYNILVIVI